MSRDDDEMLKAERRRMAAAFDDVLREPVPERLTALLQAPAAPVVDLAEARARRRGMPGWAAWGGMAATLVLGTLLGTRLLMHVRSTQLRWVFIVVLSIVSLQMLVKGIGIQL